MGTESLNYTKEGYVDYTYLNPEDPPRFLHFEFEKIDYKSVLLFMQKNQELAYLVISIYLIVIFGIQKFMKNREPFKIKGALFLWNGALGIMSIMGFIRIGPEALFKIRDGGFHKSVCFRQTGSVPLSFWAFIFMASKFVELGDTLFIVLRKKPLTFLQWGHHSLTLFLVWITSPYLEPISIYFMIMNYSVHSLMYPYFALKAINVRIPRPVAKFITASQFLQMIMGLFISVYTSVIFYSGSTCARHPTSVQSFNVVYGLFLFLFGRLFYDNVVAKSFNKKKTE